MNNKEKKLRKELEELIHNQKVLFSPEVVKKALELEAEIWDV